MPHVKVIVAGSGDAFAAGGNFYSCFFIDNSTEGILLDCGSSSMVALKRLGISTNRIGHIVISHFHGDHFGGLPYFLLDAAIRSRRNKKLTVYCPKGGETRVAELCGLLYPGSSGLLGSFPIEFIEFWHEDEISTSFGKIYTYPAVHNEGSHPHSLRIVTGGKVIGYSADTGWNDHLIPVAKDSDLFLCECSFYKMKTANHISWVDLKDKLELLDSKRIILTHLGDEALENVRHIPIEIAFHGMEIIL